MTYLITALVFALLVTVAAIRRLRRENADLRRTLTMSRPPAGKRLGGQR